MSDEQNTIDAESIESESIMVVQPSGLAAIAKSEVESQLDAAHRYPRKISAFVNEAKSMIARSEDVAAMCFYTLPPRRGGDGKSITGPSVRLAEIAASAYGNLHYGARPVDVSETEVTSQGVAWDLQKNVRVTVEKKRRITTRNGQRFGDDMIIVTQNAASSIVLRDAVFRVIPRAYIQELDTFARKVAIGDAKTLGDRRAKAFEYFAKMGATRERVLAAVGRDDIEAVTLEDMEKLVGFSTSIKDGQATVDECFPAVKQADAPAPTESEEGKRSKLDLSGGKKHVVTIQIPPGEETRK